MFKLVGFVVPQTVIAAVLNAAVGFGLTVTFAVLEDVTVLEQPVPLTIDEKV
jgi:hypothetical protein